MQPHLYEEPLHACINPIYAVVKITRRDSDDSVTGRSYCASTVQFGDDRHQPIISPFIG